MKLIEINKERYRKHLNIVIVAFISSLLILSLTFGTILINLFSSVNEIVLTKADKILKVENQAKLVLKEVEKRKAIFPKILITSSKSKSGVDKIRQEIANLLN